MISGLCFNVVIKVSTKFKNMQHDGYGRTTMTGLTWELAV